MSTGDQKLLSLQRTYSFSLRMSAGPGHMLAGPVRKDSETSTVHFNFRVKQFFKGFPQVLPIFPLSHFLIGLGKEKMKA